MAPPGLSGGKVMSHAHVVMESRHQPDANAAADVNDKVTALFPQQDDEAVDSALELFNRMSRQITDSYRTLESRVNQLSGELPGELNGLSIDIGTEIIDYEPNPSPPPLIRCVHRLLSSVFFQVDGGSLRLGFAIPCDCTE